MCSYFYIILLGKNAVFIRCSLYSLNSQKEMVGFFWFFGFLVPKGIHLIHLIRQANETNVTGNNE